MDQTNHFLSSLTPAALTLLLPHLELVELDRDSVVAQVDGVVDWAVLPRDAIISVITVMVDGDQIESRTIGRESGFGLLHALGSGASFERVIVQVGGAAWRIRTLALKAAAVQNAELMDAIARHAQATIVQAAQFIACNTLHSVQARLCRWLLMTQDRLGSNVVPLTQEHLAIMLGVQRTTVTSLAQVLQRNGLIRYRRGKITILDRDALMALSCECYDALQHSSRKLLGDHAAPLQRGHGEPGLAGFGFKRPSGRQSFRRGLR